MVVNFLGPSAASANLYYGALCICEVIQISSHMSNATIVHQDQGERHSTLRDIYSLL